MRRFLVRPKKAGIYAPLTRKTSTFGSAGGMLAR
jgi:hypothetical protein